MAEVVELDICYLCDEGFQDLEEHFYDKHTAWKHFKCDFCNKDYSSDKELQKHINATHIVDSDVLQNITKHKSKKSNLEEKDHIRTCKKNSENESEDIKILYESSQKCWCDHTTSSYI